VPLVAPLASPLSLGKNISIKGVVPLYSEFFTITIQSGPEYPLDSVVIMDIVSNFSSSNDKTSLCRYDGKWQCEDHNQAFALGHSFHLVITCLKDKFKVKMRSVKQSQKCYNLHKQNPMMDTARIGAQIIVSCRYQSTEKNLPRTT